MPAFMSIRFPGAYPKLTSPASDVRVDGLLDGGVDGGGTYSAEHLLQMPVARSLALRRRRRSSFSTVGHSESS